MKPVPVKPRLLVVGAFPPPDSKIFGGIVTSCRAMLDSSFPSQFELSLLDSTQISNPPPGLAVRALLAVRRFAAFLVRLVTFRPQAVLLFASAGASLAEKGLMAGCARLAGRKALLFPRGGRVMDRARASPRQRAWIRLAFRAPHAVLCQGPAWQRFMVEEIGLPEQRAPVLPNWTATERLLSLGRRRFVQPTRGEALQLLFLGWLEADKGIFELLRACAALRDHDGAPFTLTIAGRGHAEAQARQLVQELGLGERVHFAGWLQGADLEERLVRSDVVVLPSWAEGLPNAMIESMAAGLAVVASAVGNIPDVVADGVEALLVPPRDVPALAAALRRVLQEPALRASLQRGGHALAGTRFAVEPAMERLAAIVSSTLTAR